MIPIKYNMQISNQTAENLFKKFINQTYKLLPMREEKQDWEKLLQTLIEQLAGLNRLLIGQSQSFFLLLCKMEGLFELIQDNDFLQFRRTIFECLNLLNDIEKDVIGT